MAKGFPLVAPAGHKPRKYTKRAKPYSSSLFPPGATPRQSKTHTKRIARPKSPTPAESETSESTLSASSLSEFSSSESSSTESLSTESSSIESSSTESSSTESSSTESLLPERSCLYIPPGQTRADAVFGPDPVWPTPAGIPPEVRGLAMNSLEPNGVQWLTSMATFGAPVPSSSPLQPRSRRSAFPVFNDGDVIITTDLGHGTRTFQLHSSVLCRHSRFFSDSLQGILEQTFCPSWHSFSIQDVNGKVELVRHYTDGKRPRVEAKIPTIIDGTKIKIEEASDETMPRSSADDPSARMAVFTYNALHTSAVQCYATVLATFYHLAPQLSKTDIATALVQGEKLVKVATYMGSMQIMCSHLGLAFSNFRQELFVAIKKDPGRWINMGIALRNRSIYDECFVHMVGAYPMWEWPTKRSKVPDAVHRLVKHKATELRRMRIEVERDLTKINILVTNMYDGTSHPPDPTRPREIETWVTVQYVRSEVYKHIDDVDEHPERALHFGKLFRGIHRQNLPWLDTWKAREYCLRVRSMICMDLDEDMVTLRNEAAKIVKPLVDNQLMIEPDTHGVGYLTCVKVQDSDVVWLVEPREAWNQVG